MTKQELSYSPRAWAAELVRQVLDEGKSLSALLPMVQPSLNAKDMALLQEMVFGICRVLPRLEQIVAEWVDKPLKGKTRIVHCLLLVGLYQLLYLRVPDHAAISETVNACKMLRVDSFRGLVNGVLRRFQREQQRVLAKVDKHWQTYHPEWLVNRLKKAYPNWREVIEANNQKPPMWIRVHKRWDRAAYLQQLGELAENAVDPTACVPDCAVLLRQAVSVSQLPEFEAGAVTVQDLHAQWAALLLGAENGEQVLDACAAPGGKTTHILELAPQAIVTALDIEAARLTRVQENLARLGQQARVICGDAARPEQWLEEGVQFDRILLDAPCSATGVIRRHPDIKWLRKESDIAELVALQAAILRALWQRLKPNGTLLYATCSVLPEENREQIERFLAQTANARLVPLDFVCANGESKRSDMQQFLPMPHSSTPLSPTPLLPTPQGGDGFFYAKLIKVAE